MPQSINPFLSRPPMLRQCSTCNGRGHVVNQYWLHPAIPPYADKLDGAPDGALSAVIVGSPSIFEVCREAKELARHSGRAVVFYFTSDVVVVRANDDADAIANAWFLETYGESADAMLARR